MEQSIASAVISALQQNKTPMNMEVEHHDNESIATSTHETTTTIKTMMDKFKSLANMVSLLADKVSEIATLQEAAANKRTRAISITPRQLLKDMENAQNIETRSPPTKQPWSLLPTPPKILPPHGHPKKSGAREGE
jgi:hypothetical protein